MTKDDKFKNTVLKALKVILKCLSRPSFPEHDRITDVLRDLDQHTRKKEDNDSK